MYRLVCRYQHFKIPWRWRQKFLLNVGNYLPKYTASHPLRPYTQIFYLVPLQRLKNLKVNFSRNKPWRLRLGIELWASILTMTFGTTRTTFQLYAPAPLYPQGNFLVLISVRSWVDPRTTESRQKESVTWKFSTTLPGIEPGACRLVVHCLNQLRHRSSLRI
jgi:hypothetical protein